MIVRDIYNHTHTETRGLHSSVTSLLCLLCFTQTRQLCHLSENRRNQTKDLSPLAVNHIYTPLFRGDCAYCEVTDLYEETHSTLWNAKHTLSIWISWSEDPPMHIIYFMWCYWLKSVTHLDHVEQNILHWMSSDLLDVTRCQWTHRYKDKSNGKYNYSVLYIYIYIDSVFLFDCFIGWNAVNLDFKNL